MRVRKGGISREIKEKDLQAYREKGYSVVQEQSSKIDVERDKPAKRKKEG